MATTGLAHGRLQHQLGTTSLLGPRIGGSPQARGRQARLSAATRRTNRRVAGRGQLVVSAAAGGFGGGNGGAGVNIPNLVSALLTTLGIPHTINGVRKFLGGGGGGGGGGNAFNQVRRLIDYFFSGEFEFLPIPCVPCLTACSQGGKQVNIERVVAAVENLVRGMDRVCRHTQKKSLIEVLYDRLTKLINGKLKSKKIAVLQHTGIRPVFGLGKLIQYDVTRGLRVKVLDWVFTEYVDYYLGGTRYYNLQKLNAELFSKYRPQVIAFLQGTEGDLAPVMGFLVRHLIEFNKVNMRYPHVGCALCQNAAFSCEKRMGLAQSAVAKKAAGAVLKRMPRLPGGSGRPITGVKIVRTAPQGARRLVARTR